MHVKSVLNPLSLFSSSSSMHVGCIKRCTPLHMAVCDTYCPICLTQLHTRHRLLEHIKYKGKKRHCATILLSQPFIISETEARQLDLEAANSARQLAHSGLRRSYAAKPAHRIPGPLLPLSHEYFYRCLLVSLASFPTVARLLI